VVGKGKVEEAAGLGERNYLTTDAFLTAYFFAEFYLLGCEFSILAVDCGLRGD